MIDNLQHSKNINYFTKNMISSLTSGLFCFFLLQTEDLLNYGNKIDSCVFKASCYLATIYFISVEQSIVKKVLQTV